MLMRGRRPTVNDLKRTALGILQSTAFLTTSAFTYCLFLCIIRRYVGHLNFYTASYVPAFMSSVCAILLERPSRRGLLCLYVSNVATDTVYNMLVVRGWLPAPIRNGQVLIFGASAAALLYYYRAGLAQQKRRPTAAAAGGAAAAAAVASERSDSIFDILRFVVGAGEATIGGAEQSGGAAAAVPNVQQPRTPPLRSRNNGGGGAARRFPLLMNAVRVYGAFIRRFGRHSTCPHRKSCVQYAIGAGGRLFAIGLGIQVALRCVLQAQQIWQRGFGYLWRRVLCQWSTARLAVFLGGFATLFRVSYYICVGNQRLFFVNPFG